MLKQEKAKEPMGWECGKCRKKHMSNALRYSILHINSGGGNLYFI
jgi:hypothetical protein